MFLLISSFFAGVLTSLAPCILPLLPVIVGSSILSDGNEKRDRLKPYIITASLAVSVVLFTLLLKVSSIFIGLNPDVLTAISGAIVVVIGMTMFFPNLWVKVSGAIGLEHSSNKLLASASKRTGVGGSIMTGVALGPVFSSCSPVYALVLATVLPVNLTLGITYIIAFALGLGLALLAIALAGRKLTKKLGWAVNPDGAFRKVLAAILIAVGVLVLTGNIQRLQVAAAQYFPGFSALEQKLVPSNGRQDSLLNNGNEVFNVEPYDAPELRGIADWINSDPTTLAQLKGKVVLIDFWTYSCINCQRTQPYLNAWYDKYNDKGFEIIGVHAPEFAFEKVPENVRKAVKDDDIKYPVALDNDFATWQAYENQYWPAKYLIDKDGKIRYTHFGEGEYDTTEKAIQALLKENGRSVTSNIETPSDVPVRDGQSPETYLNYQRGERFANTDQFKADTSVNYVAKNDLAADNWSLGGSWKVGATETVATGDDSVLRFKFSAKEVYLVMDGPDNQPVTVELNGKKVTAATNGGEDVDKKGNITLDAARLYKLIKLGDFTEGQVIDVTVPKGTTINAFTFGS